MGTFAEDTVGEILDDISEAVGAFVLNLGHSRSRSGVGLVISISFSMHYEHANANGMFPMTMVVMVYTRLS